MDEHRLNCMVRDPHWIYCYWELASDAVERAAGGRGPRLLETVRWVLRVSTLEGAGPGENEPYDVEVDANAGSWYLKVRPGRRMRVELGLVSAGGGFVTLVSGEEVETPPEPLGEIAAGDWGRLKPELERLVARGLVGSSATSSGSMHGGAAVSADGQASGVPASSAASDRR